MKSEVESRADFSHIRYAQCWEDADILVEAMNITPDSTCLSIASAGDNSLALLVKNPRKVIAIDLSRTQLFCLELRITAYKTLEHIELLELFGSRDSKQRADLYQKCRPLLSDDARGFWDSNREKINAGVGSAGKFENYFRIFRNRILPLIHSGKITNELLESRDHVERIEFYEQKWNNWKWRLLFRLFFSRFVMGRMGRDPDFFKYVEGSVSQRILNRVKYALTELDPSSNPYLYWIIKGKHADALPYPLRKDNFDRIRNNIGKLEWHQASVEEYLASVGSDSIDSYNLSDIFEYMSEENYHRLLNLLYDSGKKDGRLVYWNMLAERSRPEYLSGKLQPLKDLSENLFMKDKAFFYSRFVVEQITK